MKFRTAIAAAATASLFAAGAHAAVIATIVAGQADGTPDIVVNNVSNVAFDSMRFNAFGNGYPLGGLAAGSSFKINIIGADYDSDIPFSISVTINGNTYSSPAITEASNLSGGYVDYGGSGADIDFTPVLVGNIQATLGSVPEPTSWALMILGLGGVGVALRRTQRRAPTAA